MPHDAAQSILLTGEPVTSLDAYRERGGIAAYEQVVRDGPDHTIETLRQARLRGRGGAGFPTAIKWDNLRRSGATTRYVVCNGAEGEPGTFKDRMLLRHNPYQVIEGLAIAAEVVGAKAAYIGVKKLFEPMLSALEPALAQMQDAVPAARKIEIVWGPDEYLFGEEKALLSVIEGGLPLPRVLPPYLHGLFTGAYGGPSEEESNPTAVNNVETLSHVPHIIRNGAAWFRGYGTEDTPGTMVFSVLGDVRRPVVRELPLGLTLRELIDGVADGVPPGRSVKAVFPGLANAVITAARLDTPLGFDSMRNGGSALGSGGFVVYDDTACMVKAAEMFSHFLHVESCNQCPPCKIGSGRISERLERLMRFDAQASDVDEIAETATWVTNGQRCYLATSEQLVVASILAAFPADFEAHLAGSCGLRHDLVLPKITDYREGAGFTFDTEYWRKQPDWTYV
jgi:NADH:ubiquinone oxidoreductase subunit F (NADH-binding)